MAVRDIMMAFRVVIATTLAPGWRGDGRSEGPPGHTHCKSTQNVTSCERANQTRGIGRITRHMELSQLICVRTMERQSPLPTLNLMSPASDLVSASESTRFPAEILLHID